MIAKEQIEAWKEKYKEIFSAKAGEKEAFFRKPSRKELSYALTLQDKPLEMQEAILKNCFLGGDTCFYEDLEYMLGCSSIVEQMVEVKAVEVKKF